MAFESFVGFRYLMAKRRHNVLSIITLISIGGVAVGVMALIVVLSVMGGFEGDLRQKIIGAKAHIVVSHEDGSLTNYDALVARVEAVPGVVGASPYVEGEVMVNSATNLQGVVVRGIVPETIVSVSNLPDSMQEGGLQYLDDPGALPDLRHAVVPYDRSWGGFLVQSDAPDGEPDAQRLREMKAAGAKAAVSFAGADHGRFVTEVVRGEVAVRASGAPSEAEPSETEPSEAASEGEPGEPAEARRVDPDAEAEASAVSDSAQTEESAAGTQSDGQDVEEEEEEEAALGAEVRLSTATLEPASKPKRRMKQVPGLAGDETPVERRVGGLLLGLELQENLNVFLGHEVNLMSPMGDLGPTGSVPKSRPFRVVGVFYSGMYEFDTKLVYITLPDAQRFLNLEGRATGIEVKVEDIERSGEVKAAIETILADVDGVQVKDWRQLNGNLFSALELEKIAMFVILTFVILVASFNIICLLIMIVIEKGREIAIIKSMGANNQSIMKIFVLQGGVIGVLGTAIGCVVGLSLCWVIANWGIQLPADVYYLSHVPVEVRPYEVAAICGAAVLISLLATIPPSILAALLDPVAGLRYD